MPAYLQPHFASTLPCPILMPLPQLKRDELATKEPLFKLEQPSWNRGSKELWLLSGRLGHACLQISRREVHLLWRFMVLYLFLSLRPPWGTWTEYFHQHYGTNSFATLLWERLAVVDIFEDFVSYFLFVHERFQAKLVSHSFMAM